MNIGDTYEVKDVVTDKNTAASLGSGALPVFGTPFLIAMMENAAFSYMQERLPEGKSSVGVKIDIEHVSPTPIGMAVRVVAEVTHVSENGKMVDFSVKGYDDAGLIGEGMHRRAVVDVERFLAKCNGKKAQ